MKKIFFVVLCFLFMFSSFATAGEKCKGHKAQAEGKVVMHKVCYLYNLNADFNVKNTKDGVVITIKAKKDGDDVETIQKKAKECVEMCNKMASESDEEVICPVMGKKMKKKDAYSSMEYKGKMYYFCCAHCVDEFKKNPEKYAK